MTNKQKRMLTRLAFGGIVFVGALLIPLEGVWRWVLFLPAYLVIGGDILLKACRNIVRGQVFDENFLMCVATIGAFMVGEYPEGVAVMLFYQVGEWFQGYAVNRSRESIAGLMNIRPDYANVLRDGQSLRVDPEDVGIGESILVRPGEKIPLDGIVTVGTSMADTAALTGESLPRTLSPGDEALSGCINLSGVLTICVSKTFGESTVSKILELVENAAGKKAKTENFITRFARVYTPCVVIAAALLAVLPPLLLDGATFTEWVHRALIFLVISCPCALVISVPLSFFGGIGGASRCGILIKGSNYLEALAQAQIVVFDKTGTLTEGAFTVTQLHAVQDTPVAQAELLKLAAYAECHSSHPISLSLRNAYAQTIEDDMVCEVKEEAGFGVCAQVGGKTVYAGNAGLMEHAGVAVVPSGDVGTVVHVAADGIYLGYIVIEDAPKEDAAQAIRELKSMGVRRCVMLTGDTLSAGERVGTLLGIDEVHTGLLPGDKVERVEQLLQEKTPEGRLLFVGDGINDAPVLSRADIGIAMGGLGSDAAIEAADVVIMDDKPSKIALAVRISRKTLRIVRQNIVFALGVKAVVLLLGAVGFATMWAAVFADVGVSVLAILNAMRALKTK